MSPDTTTLLERLYLPMSSARMAAQIIADAFNDARCYPGETTRPLAATEMDNRRNDALEWLTDTISDHLFSLRGCCRLLSISSGRYFSPESIASMIAAGERPTARPHYRNKQ